MRAYDAFGNASKGRSLEGGLRRERKRKGIYEQANTCYPPYIQPPTTEVDRFDFLAELALDMRWSWNHATDQVWRHLDPKLWEITHNPGLSCRPSRVIRSNACWPIPFFAKALMIFSELASCGGGAGLVSATSSAGSPELRGVFQYGIHVE